MIDYFFHKVDPKNIKISMVMIVKNEEDIIKENIVFHSKIGVDNFVILDNGSTDFTYDILNELKKEYEITLLQDSGVFYQSKLTTKITKIAKKKYNPDWIITSDADEFWKPIESKNLKEVLNFKGSILQIPRNNMILYEGLDEWKNSIYRVANQILSLEDYENLNIQLGRIGRKVIINPHGYFKTNSGNHSAEHIAFWAKKEFKKIRVYHYPIRSFEQFLINAKVRIEALKNGAKMGAHIKKWAKLLEDGKLEEEFYNRLLLNEEKIKCLLDLNVLKKDTSMKELFEKFNI